MTPCTMLFPFVLAKFTLSLKIWHICVAIDIFLFNVTGLKYGLMLVLVSCCFTSYDSLKKELHLNQITILALL